MIATAEFPIADLLDDGINDDSVSMCDADGNEVGTLGVNINFEAGDGKYFAPQTTHPIETRSNQPCSVTSSVNAFQLFGSMLHKGGD